MPDSKPSGNCTTPPWTMSPSRCSYITLNSAHLPYDMCSISPLNGPHLSLVTHTWPPEELSVSLWLSQQIGLPGFVGVCGMRPRSVTPRKSPFLTKLSRHVGIHVPSLSATVTSPLGPVPMPLGARTPVANTSNLLPSFDTLSTQPLWSVIVSHPRPPGRTGPALA